MAQTKTDTGRTEPSFLNRDYTSFLRGMCMMMILFSHTANEFTDLLAQYHLNGMLVCGRFATGIFFFLSGYGLTLSVHRNRIDSSYVCRHLRNLLCPYIIFWLFYFLTGLCAGHFPSAHALLFADFLLLKMPDADAWFFRTILGVYIVYFAMARFMKPYSGTGVAVLIVLYVSVLVISGVSDWWWNTVLCFPVGILYANYPHVLSKRLPLKGFVVIACLFVVCYRFVPFHLVRAILPPVICCLFFASLSLRVSVPKKESVIGFMGRNSLYVYFMEAIPIDYMDSEEVGLSVFVLGSMLATLVLTCVGKSVETLCLRR